MGEEKRLFLWGGLAGMLGPVFTILTAVTFFGFVPRAPAGLHGSVMRYPNARVAFEVGETFSIVGGILGVAFTLALFQALRGKALAPALWGTGLTLLGRAVLAAEGVPRVVFSRISDLYHAPAATVQDRATLALIWQATQGLFNEFDTAAIIFVLKGAILLGIAMFPNPAFGKGFGIIIIVLALAGLIGLYALGIDSIVFAALALPGFIVIPFLLGWKLYRLSKAA